MTYDSRNRKLTPFGFGRNTQRAACGPVRCYICRSLFVEHSKLNKIKLPFDNGVSCIPLFCCLFGLWRSNHPLFFPYGSTRSTPSRSLSDRADIMLSEGSRHSELPCGFSFEFPDENNVNSSPRFDSRSRGQFCPLHFFIQRLEENSRPMCVSAMGGFTNTPLPAVMPPARSVSPPGYMWAQS